MELKTSRYRKRELIFRVAGYVLAVLLLAYIISFIISVQSRAREAFQAGSGDVFEEKNFDFERYDEVIKKIEGETFDQTE